MCVFWLLLTPYSRILERPGSIVRSLPFSIHTHHSLTSQMTSSNLITFNTISIKMQNSYFYSRILCFPVDGNSSQQSFKVSSHPRLFLPHSTSDPSAKLVGSAFESQDPSVSEHLHCGHPPGPCHPLPEFSRMTPPHDHSTPWTLFTRQLPEGPILNAGQVIWVTALNPPLASQFTQRKAKTTSLAYQTFT